MSRKAKQDQVVKTEEIAVGVTTTNAVNNGANNAEYVYVSPPINFPKVSVELTLTLDLREGDIMFAKPTLRIDGVDLGADIDTQLAPLKNGGFDKIYDAVKAALMSKVKPRKVN